MNLNNKKGNSVMKRKHLFRIISLLITCVVLIGVLMLAAFATTDHNTVDIYRKNIIFDDKLQLMFAVNAPAYVEVTAKCGDKTVDIEYRGNKTIDGVDCRIYCTVDGWAPQNINETVTVTATANGKTDVLTYSVLMYLYERLNLDNLDPETEADRIAMYEALFAYAKATDKVVNNQNGKTPNDLDSYHYVSVVNGTLDGYNEWGMFKAGQTPFADIEHALELGENEIAKWSYTLNGENMGYISLDDLKTLAVEGAITVTAESVVKGTHTDHSMSKPITSEAELIEALTAGGSYYLTEDIAVNATVSTSAEVELCLNGHILSAAESNTSFSIIKVTSNAKLTLVDCDTTERVGYIENDVWTEGTKEDAEAVTIVGGMITGGHAEQGGAIYSTGTLEVYNIDFVNNNVTGEKAMGGAIYCTTNAKLNVYASNFVANSSAYQGGAIYVTSNADVYTVTDTNFIGNYVSNSSYGGGAIYNTAANGEYTRVSFIGNYSCKAGAIALHSGSEITINSMVAENNRAVLHTYVDSETQEEKSNNGIGGVFYINSSTLNLTEDSDEIVIRNNTAELGGAIYVEINKDVPVVNISGADFINNTANLGGAIYAAGSSVNIHGGSFSGNTATKEHGGAIYASTISQQITEVVIADNCTFTNNTATSHGGAVYLTHSSKIGSTLVMTGGSFIGNTSASGGAVSARTGASATFYGTDFTNNSVTGASEGGAIYAGYATLNVNGGTFTANTAKNGAAIYLVGDEDNYKVANATVDSATFTSNTATGNGGAIYIGGVSGASTLTVTNSTFGGANGLGNTAPYGGAIFAKDTVTLNVSKSLFEGNKATTYQGGAIRCDSITALNIMESKFVSNTATTEGGAVYMTGCASYEITDTEFAYNSTNWCKRGGGAIYMTSSKGTINNVTFTGNSSAKGGAVALHGSSVMTVNSMTATDNFAEAYTCTCTDNSNCNFGIGGVFYVGWSTLTINGTANIDDNTAVTGGAIYNDGGTVTLNETSFTENVASTAGGAIYSAGGNVTANGGTYTSNNATNTTGTTKGGGAICIVSKATATIAGATFTSNSSGYYGGTIAAYDSTLTIKADENGNKTVIENSKGATGSAICYKDGDDNQANGTYVINGLEVKGTNGTGSGVIYSNEGTISINDLTATNNYSKSGGLYHTSGGVSFEIKNSTFNSNDAPLGAINFAATSKTLVLENITLIGAKDTITGNYKATIVIRYTTEEEKTALTNATTLLGNATISYVDISAQ